MIAGPNQGERNHGNRIHELTAPNVQCARPRTPPGVCLLAYRGFGCTGIAEQWPTQFGGKGDPSQITTQWISQGTALSPPLFLLVGVVVALGLLAAGERRAMVRAGAALASMIGVIGTIGALGELLADPTPDVPRLVQQAAVIGVIVSAAVVITGVALLRVQFGAQHGAG